MAYLCACEQKVQSQKRNKDSCLVSAWAISELSQQTYVCVCVCVCVSQGIILDTLSQAAVGHPAVQPGTYSECKLRANISVTTRAGNTITADQIHRNALGLVEYVARTVHLEVSARNPYYTCMR